MVSASHHYQNQITTLKRTHFSLAGILFVRPIHE